MRGKAILLEGMKGDQYPAYVDIALTSDALFIRKTQDNEAEIDSAMDHNNNGLAAINSPEIDSEKVKAKWMKINRNDICSTDAHLDEETVKNLSLKWKEEEIKKLEQRRIEKAKKKMQKAHSNSLNRGRAKVKIQETKKEKELIVEDKITMENCTCIIALPICQSSRTRQLVKFIISFPFSAHDNTIFTLNNSNSQSLLSNSNSNLIPNILSNSVAKLHLNTILNNTTNNNNNSHSNNNNNSHISNNNNNSHSSNCSDDDSGDISNRNSSDNNNNTHLIHKDNSSGNSGSNNSSNNNVENSNNTNDASSMKTSKSCPDFPSISDGDNGHNAHEHVSGATHNSNNENIWKFALCRWLAFGRIINTSQPRRRRLLILVNPYSGTGKGPKTAQSVIHVLENIKHYDIKVQYTQRPLHAFEIAQTLTLEHFDGLVCVSGDGLLHEVVNGLLSRPDREKARKLVLGIVPAGSGNGLASSFGLTPGDWGESTLRIAHWRTQPLDIIETLLGKKTVCSFLFVGFGMISDIDFGSESLRWIGNLRFMILGLWRGLLFQRNRTAKVVIKAIMEKTINDKGEPEMTPVSEESREKVFETSWAFIGACNVPKLSDDFICAPYANTWDGKIDVILWPSGTPKFSFLKGVIFKKPLHLRLPDIQYFTTDSMKLELPNEENMEYVTTLDIDGEQYEIPKDNRTINLTIHRGYCTLII